MVFKRVIRHFAVLALMAGLFATTAESRQVSASTSKYGGTLKVAFGQGLPGFCIANNPQETNLNVFRSIYEPLVEKRNDGELTGVLATSFSGSNDFKTWQIQIRSGVKFHDGSDLDAAVVAKNINWLRGAPYLSDSYGHSLGVASLLWSNVVNAVAEDSSTVVVELEKADARFQESLWMGGRLFIRGSAQLGSSGVDCANNPIGTGPFKIRLWNDSGLIVDRFDDYWRVDKDGNQLPYLDTITFKHIFEASNRASAVRAGTQDVAIFQSSAEFPSIKNLRDDSSVVNEFRSSRSYATGLWLNQGLADTSLQSLKARQAVAASLDLDNLRLSSSRWELSPPSNNPGHSRSLLGGVNNAYDLMRARQLVGEYETENAKSLSFRITHSIASQESSTAAELVNRWDLAGISSTRHAEEALVIISKLYNSATGNSLEATVVSIFADGFPDLLPYLKSSVFEGSANPLGAISATLGSTMNISRHSDTGITDLLDEARAINIPQVRRRKMQEVSEKIAEKVMFLPFGNAYISTFTTKYVHGVGAASIEPGMMRPIDSIAGLDYSTVYKSSEIAEVSAGQELFSAPLVRFSEGPLSSLANTATESFIYGIDPLDNAIQRFSLTNDEQISRIEFPSSFDGEVDSISGLVVEEVSNKAYVSDQGNGKIYEISLSSETMKVLGSYPGALTDLCLSTNGSYLFALDSAQQNLLKIDRVTGELLIQKKLDDDKNYSIPSQSVDGEITLVEKNSGLVKRLSSATLGEISSMNLGFESGPGVIMGDGRYLLLVDRTANLVKQIDLSTGETLTSFSGGDFPRTLASVGSGKLAIHDSANSVVALVELPSMSTPTTPSTPETPSVPATPSTPGTPSAPADISPPTAIWTSPESSESLEVVYELEFSENITGLTAGDLVNGGNAPGCIFSVEGSRSRYTVTVTCAGPGTLRPVLLDGSVFDEAKNTGPAKNVLGKLISVGVLPQTSTSTSTTVVAVPVVNSARIFSMPVSSGRAVEISKPPVRTLSTKTLLAVSGKKVTVGLEVPKAKKKDAQVVRYVIELRTSTGVRVVKVKPGQRITPALNGKKKGSYVVVVTAVQKSGKKLTWTGPRVKVS